MEGTMEENRRSIRLKNYDYSYPGAYFITICTQHRKYLFGNVIDGKMQLNKFGKIVKAEWLETPIIRQNVELDMFVIMPNHLHGIIVIVDDTNVGAYSNTPLQKTNTFRSPSRTLGAIIRGFKSAATKNINEYRWTPGIPVWQRNYYEHIIRSKGELSRIREYIHTNPLKWEFDRENPVSRNFNLDHDLYWEGIYD